jgi:hypothetical protein
MTIRSRFGAFIVAAALAIAPVAAFAQQQTFNGAANFIGKINTGGAVPSLTSCGTGPATGVGMNNRSGRFVTGSAVTTCNVVFNAAEAWGPSSPVCLISAEVPTQPTFTVSATQITLTVVLASTAYQYMCIGVGSQS